MIEDMQDIKGEGPVELLLADPLAILSGATTVAYVEDLLIGLMAYWKTLDPTAEPHLYHHVGAIYAKAMLRRKALAQPGKTQSLIETKQASTTATDQLLAEIGKTLLLKPNMQAFHSVVTSHPALTFEEATERLTQGMMTNIINLYGTIVPKCHMGYFIEQLAKTLEFKRKIILSGKVGQAYKAIWQKAQVEVTTGTTPVSPSALDIVDAALTPPVTPKPKIYKSPKPSKLPFWRNVTDVCAVICPSCGITGLIGRSIDAVSPFTEQAMLAFAKKELSYFDKWSITLPLAVGKYNFLMTLFAQPVCLVPERPNEVMADVAGAIYVIETVGTGVRVRLTDEVPVY